MPGKGCRRLDPTLLCGARNRQGQVCKQLRVTGRNRCHYHGGKSRVGMANGTYRNGRFSKYLPARMQGAYQASLKDPELLSLRNEVAAIDARLIDLFQRVDTGESGQLWKTLRKEWDEFALVRATGDVPGMHRLLARLDVVMERAIRDDLAWAEISEKIEERRKLVESEQKRLQLSHQMLTVDQAMHMMGAFMGILTRHVTDKNALSQIIVDLQVLVMREQQNTPDPVDAESAEFTNAAVAIRDRHPAKADQSSGNLDFGGDGATDA